MTEEEILTLDDDATDTPMEEVQVAGMGPLTEQARGALRRLGLLPAPEDTGIGSSLTTELGRARLKARELEKREAELSETIAGQTQVRGARGIGGGQAEITDEGLVPLPRYKVSETETGFIVLDEADGTVLDIFETQAEAAAFVTNRTTLSRSGPPEPTITPDADDAVPPEQLDPDAGMDQENLFERTQAEGKYDQHTEIDLG